MASGSIPLSPFSGGVTADAVAAAKPVTTDKREHREPFSHVGRESGSREALELALRRCPGPHG